MLALQFPQIWSEMSVKAASLSIPSVWGPLTFKPDALVTWTWLMIRSQSVCDLFLMKITLDRMKMQGVVPGSNSFHASDFPRFWEKILIRLLFGQKLGIRLESHVSAAACTLSDQRFFSARYRWYKGPKSAFNTANTKQRWWGHQQGVVRRSEPSVQRHISHLDSMSAIRN